MNETLQPMDTILQLVRQVAEPSTLFSLKICWFKKKTYIYDHVFVIMCIMFINLHQFFGPSLPGKETDGQCDEHSRGSAAQGFDRQLIHHASRNGHH